MSDWADRAARKCYDAGMVQAFDDVKAMSQDALTKAIAAALREERERCAKVADTTGAAIVRRHDAWRSVAAAEPLGMALIGAVTDPDEYTRQMAAMQDTARRIAAAIREQAT